MFSSIVILCFVLTSSVVQAAGLIEVLQNSDASEYANFIQSDPTLSALYSSGQAQTVFAPIDGSVQPSLRKVRRQTSPAQEQQGSFQGVQRLNSYASLSIPPGAILKSLDKSGNIGGNPQSVVSNPSDKTQSSANKRWASHLSPPNGNYSSLLKIYSGLGNFVNIIYADIPFDGGLVHVVDGYFTLPQPLSTTASANGHTSFLSAANSSNLTSSLDNTPSLTVFIPNNGAFSQSNASSIYPSSSSLLSGHIIPNFLGYLPALSNGAIFTTTAGTNVTITIKGSDYYVNNAKIIASNQILENGVAHVVDAIIEPSTPLPLPFEASAPPTKTILTAFLVGTIAALWFAAGIII